MHSNGGPPTAGGDGGGGSPVERIKGWPAGSQPPSWQTQPGPGTGGMQLFPLGGGAGVGGAPAPSGPAGAITAKTNDRTHKPARRIIPHGVETAAERGRHPLITLGGAEADTQGSSGDKAIGHAGRAGPCRERPVVLLRCAGGRSRPPFLVEHCRAPLVTDGLGLRRLRRTRTDWMRTFGGSHHRHEMVSSPPMSTLMSWRRLTFSTSTRHTRRSFLITRRGGRFGSGP